jgi:glutamate:GABA antiporter
MRDRRDREAALLREERRVEARSSAFKKELGLTDLALTQILFIIGLPWIGVAAKQGPSHVLLWLVAMLFFYLPSAQVVIYLNRVFPLEGGLYQWAKLGGGELLGFLVAWNLWLLAILNTSEIGLQVTQYLRYVLGPSSEGWTANKVTIGAVSLALIGALVVLTTIGLGAGKWVHKAGGALMLATFGAIVALPWLNRAHGSLAAYHPLRTELPVFSLMTVNILGKMGFGALGGFEYVALHAGECRDPARTIPRSVVVAAPVIAAMFILGTSSVLALVPQAEIDLIAPIPQVLDVGFRALKIALPIAPLAILALLCIRVAQSSVMFAGNTRLPMVAGWDRLLPEGFTRLHPRFRTPIQSILLVGGVTFALSIVGLLGVGKQEAFQLLWNASGLFYALTYVAMFALPLFGLRGVEPRPSPGLRLAALSGFLMTLLYVGVSVVPLIEVQSRALFAVKIAGLILAANALGLLLYLSGRRRRARQARLAVTEGGGEALEGAPGTFP